jgi:DNA-directed RNA polymerase subunit RPC12/RpoP
MRKCPNCGQAAERTEDWACRWCGYPLLSKSYKKISGTYRQLKGEKPPEAVAASTPEYAPVVEPASQSAPEPKSTPEAVVASAPEPTPVAESALEPVPDPE